MGISLLIILLIPMGIYFTVRTRFLPIRLFPDMVRALVGTKAKKDADGKSEKKEKERKGQLVHISDADRFNGNESRDGGIWSEWLQQFQQVVPELYSGCGSRH